jgi:hypothetical protein
MNTAGNQPRTVRSDLPRLPTGIQDWIRSVIVGYPSEDHAGLRRRGRGNTMLAM